MTARDDLNQAMNLPAGASASFDPLLKYMLLGTRLPKNDEHELSLVLVTSGGVIQGYAISRTRWLRLWMESIDKHGGESVTETLKVLRKESGEHLFEDDGDPFDFNRIYLRDARIGDVGPMLMRVDPEQVIAWSNGVDRPDL